MQTKSARQPREKRQPTKKLYNMKRFSEQLHKKSQTVKLKKSEQADLRARIVSYMEYHPLPAAMKAAEVSKTKKATRSTIFTDTFAHYAIPYQMLFKFGSVAAVFVLVFIPFMAERSVPGDTLYAVKVQFNEEVRGNLTWGSYEKVEWETTLLNRRIAEARLLADEGLLTEEVEAGVAAAVKEHSDNAKREIEVLRASDVDDATIATIAFDSSLSVQAQAFGDEAAVPATATGTERTGKLISNAIGESLAKAPQAEIAAVPAYSKLMARVEQNTTRVRDLRDSLAGTVTDKDLADVSRRIEDIDRAIAVAIGLAAEEPTELEARIALTDVVVRTQKLIVFMTELDVREKVTIEEVVPMVPTSEEMSSDRSKRTAELTAVIAQITTAIETIENQAIADKLTAVQKQLQASLDLLTTIDDYKVFVVESNESLELAKDALQLVAQGGSESPVAEVPTEAVQATSTATSTDDGTSESTDTDTEAEPNASSTESVIPEATSTSTATSSDATATTTQNTQSGVDELP